MSTPDPNSAESWDERYTSTDRVWSGQPNATLVAEVSGLRPGRALDAGSGEGGDVLWLAAQGWDVVGSDVSQVGLDRAAQHVPADLAPRITWWQADLRTTPPEPDSFDLVTTHYLHAPPKTRTPVLQGLTAAVRAGGTLLVVGHDVRDTHHGPRRHQGPEVYFSLDELRGHLDGDWEVVTAEMRPRPPGGQHHTDLVFRARLSTRFGH